MCFYYMFFIVVAATYGLLNNKSHSKNVPIPKSGKSKWWAAFEMAIQEK